MSRNDTYLLISLPTSINPSGDRDEALTSLRSAVTTDYGNVFPFHVPEFKVGSLDTLVSQADELSKLESGCANVVSKVGDALKGVFDGDQEKIQQNKNVNDKPPDAYLKTFRWNKVKYRAERPLSELIDVLQKEVTSIDNDVRNKYNQYNSLKSSWTALQRKQNGNLSNKSLVNIVKPSDLVNDSEHLETHLIVVPKQQIKDFIKAYETLSPMVVPRSATLIESDDEFSLYAVTTFKKHSSEFISKSRERKWIPRDFKAKEGGREEEKKEIEKTQKDFQKAKNESINLGRTGWSEAVMAWVHVLTLRVFVETVLRYGLPLQFVCGLVITSGKLVKKAKGQLDASYAYLGGNALGRDKKGRITKEDSATSADMQAAGHTGEDYSAYVCYEFEIQ